MSKRTNPYPFTAIVGQEDMKLGLILNVIDPGIGGILAFGEKGTAKSTAVRALTQILPKIRVVKGCRFRCDPDDVSSLCEECKKTLETTGFFETEEVSMRVTDLPVSATEDRVVGTLDIEEAIKKGKKKFEPGILADANRGILYVDEVNLLDDHIVDLLLDSAAMGVNTVEREGVSYSHPARFILVGTMNPEEGELRPQLTDRFGLSVHISGINDPGQRVRILKYRNEYDEDPVAFTGKFEEQERILAEKIIKARSIINETEISDDLLFKIARTSVRLEVDGHRSDLTAMKASIAFAAFDGRTSVCEEDIKYVAPFVYLHRMKSLPFEEAKEFDPEILEQIFHGGEE